MEDPYTVYGRSYVSHRRPDPRVAAVLEAGLGEACTIVNVGAGAGAYEPADRDVTAVEPSAVMIRQRPPGSAPVVQAFAESLPFPDDSFEAGMAVLTTHHWVDPAAGLAELRRVSRRQVVLTWDHELMARFWLVADYLPEIAEMEAGLATFGFVVAELVRLGAKVRTRTVPVPADCVDGFLAAYWRRPEAYLDEAVRSSISSFVRLDQDHVERALSRLSADLGSGRWQARHAELTASETRDLGYRLIVAD